MSWKRMWVTHHTDRMTGDSRFQLSKGTGMDHPWK